MKQECAEKFLNLFRQLHDEGRQTIVKFIKNEHKTKEMDENVCDGR